MQSQNLDEGVERLRSGSVNSNPADVLQAQRSSFTAEGYPDVSVRIDRMQRAISALQKHSENIVEAVHSDFGCRSAALSQWVEVLAPVAGLSYAIANLEQWMKEDVRSIEGTGRAYVFYQPLGTIGVISPWNAPFGVGFAGFGNIFGAGNRLMIKMSEHAPAAGELAKTLLAEAFDPVEAVAVTGDAAVGAEFAALPFDHLLFTGGGSIARHVMRAAAENLTPVTLELGGKSPVIIGESANLDEAAAAVLAVRLLNAGQICFSPDYVLVPRARMENFVRSSATAARKMFRTIVDNPDYTSIVSERHYRRLKSYIAEALERGTRVEWLTDDSSNPQLEAMRKFPPALVIAPPDDLRVCNEEIFGPILPIVPYDEFNTAIERVNRGERPLALYYFGHDESEIRRVTHHTWAGGVTINDVAKHVAHPSLPFGGVGQSGMGRYLGFEGFKTFSNAKTIFVAA